MSINIWSFHFSFFSSGKDENLNHRIQYLTTSFGNLSIILVEDCSTYTHFKITSNYCQYSYIFYPLSFSCYTRNLSLILFISFHCLDMGQERVQNSLYTYQQFVFSKGTRQRMLILLQQAMGQQRSTTVQLS